MLQKVFLTAKFSIRIQLQLNVSNLCLNLHFNPLAVSRIDPLQKHFETQRLNVTISAVLCGKAQTQGSLFPQNS